MRRFVAVLALLILAAPAFAKTHKDTYNMPCSKLWPAVKDVLRGSGKYGILYMDNTEMSASYNIGGNLTGKRTNSVLLVPQGENCEMQIQTAFSGLANDDAGAFKTRVDAALVKLAGGDPTAKPAAAPAPATTPATPATTPAAPAKP